MQAEPPEGNVQEHNRLLWAATAARNHMRLYALIYSICNHFSLPFCLHGVSHHQGIIYQQRVESEGAHFFFVSLPSLTLSHLLLSEIALHGQAEKRCFQES